MGDIIKNVLKYYYDLSAENIKQYKNLYYFYVDNRYYILQVFEYLDLLEDIYKLNQEIKRYIPINEIIPNKDNQIVTKINNKYYVLEIININNKIIEFNDLLSAIPVNIKSSKLMRNNWRLLWENKIDYIENEIKENSKKYKSNINYYIGLSENAIQLLDNITVNLYISHNRIKHNNSLINYYDPLNIIIDSRVRDIAEYFKDSFFNNINIDDMLYQFLNNNDLSNGERILFLARMMFPSYYFDACENEDDEMINRITEKVNEYESLLKRIYEQINIKIDIEWL